MESNRGRCHAVRVRARSSSTVASLLMIALALGSVPAIVRAQTAAPIPSVDVSVSASVVVPGTASAPPPPPSAPPVVAKEPEPAKTTECVVPPKRGPSVLAYEEDLPVPAGYRVVHHPRTIWSRGGWAVFGVSYGIAVMGASFASNDRDPDSKKWSYLFIPVAGPLFLMGPQSEGLGNFWLATWALVQGAGLGAAIYGMSSDEVALYREDIAGAKPKRDSKPRAIAVAPVVTSGSLGLSMSGAF